MKAAKPSSPAPAAKSNSPFFNKNGGQDFFHSNDQENSFFSESKAQPVVQTKLTIGKPNDPYEQEADAVADQVVDKLSGNSAGVDKGNATGNDAPAAVQTKPLSQTITPFVQAKCASCEAEDEKKLQKKGDSEELGKSPVAEEPDKKGLRKEEAVQMKADAVQTKADAVQMKAESVQQKSELTSVQAKSASSAIQACAACDAKEKEEQELQRKPNEQDELRREPAYESEASVQMKSDAGAIQTCAACDAKEKEEQQLQRKPDASVQMKTDAGAIQTCAACDAKEKEEQELQRKPAFESEETVQTKSEAYAVQACSCEEESVQTKADSPSRDTSGVESKLNQSKGAGSSMPSGLRTGMESAFGADFSGVKIHTGSAAQDMNAGLGAHAFTHGNDIYFNSNKFSPGTKQGQKLLAHELTHTIQQGSASSVVNRSTADNLVQREGDCNTPEESPAPAAAEEASTTIERAPCAVTNPPGETPPEGTEEPREEEHPASVEANAGAPVGERQANAPAADANAPDREDGVVEGASEETAAAADPCAARDAAASAGAGAAAGAAGASGGGAAGGASSGGTGSGAAGAGSGSGSGGGTGGGGRTSVTPGSGTSATGGSGSGGSSAGGAGSSAVGSRTTGGGSSTGSSGAGSGGSVAASGSSASGGAATGAAGSSTAGATGGASTAASRGASGARAGEEATDSGTGFLTAVIARGVSPNIVPEGLGEAASPELMAGRDEQIAEENKALADLDINTESVQTLTEAGTGFMPIVTDSTQSRNVREASQRRHARSSILAHEFMRSSGDQLQQFMERARQSTTALQQQRIADRAQLEADIQSRRDETRGAFAGMRGRANARAAATEMVINARYVQTLVQIEVKSTLSTLLLMVSNIAAQTNLATAKTNQLTALDGVYNTAYNNLISVGTDVGADAETRAASHSQAYRNADGVQDPEVARKVRNREKDGFWDGYLTYNRYIARAESATEVGKQYKEGMEKEGQKQADNMMCGKHVDVEVVNTIADSGSHTLQCTYDNANDSIQRQRQAAIMQAQLTKQELSNAVQSSLQATITQLREREASNLQLINDYGIRQAMAIEKDSAMSIASMLKGVNQAVKHLSGMLTQFSTEAKAMNAPDPAQLQGNLRGMQAQFNLALSSAGNAVNNASTSSGNILSNGLAHTQSSIQQLSDDGISGGWELAGSFSSSMTAMAGSTNTTFDTLWTNVNTAMQAATDQGTAQINGVVTAITGLYTQMNAGLTTRFEESATHLRTGMTDSLNRDFDSKICSEAEKAAADVQPWWKTVLKVLLVILVIVVVALVIGPAVIGAVGALATSMAGALGAGVALAGTIGTWVGAIVGGAIVGALSGLTIQVGNNLIDAIGNGPLTWERATRGWKQAIIAGAIGGALGGLGGQLGQLLVGRLATAGISSGWQLVAEFGVNMAFDTVGGILGDLANGNPITLEGVLQGALIGAVVQLSFVGIGRMARSGEAAVEGGRAATRMQRLAMGIEGIQKGSMGFGENLGGGMGARFGGPSTEWSRNALAAAREAMAPRPRTGATEEPNTTARSGGDETSTSGRAADTDTATGTRPTEETATPRPTEDTSPTTRPSEEATTARPGEESPTTRPADETTPNPVEETATPRPGEESTTPKPGEETTSRPADEPDAARADEPTSRPSEESEGIVKADDLEEGVAAQRDLPDGHKERINENLDPEGCSNCDLLKRRYNEMFRRGQIDMDEASFNKLMGEFDQLKADLINQHGDAILDTPTDSNRGDMINGRTRQQIYDEYLGRITEIENRVLGNVRNRSLIVGEGTFEYTDALMKKLTGTTEAPNPDGSTHDITATGYQSRAEMEAINAKQGLQNPPPQGRVGVSEGQPSLSIDHNVDATNLAAKFPADSFDRIIYNNPEVPGDESAMRQLLSGVLDSAPTVLRPNGELHIGLTGSTDAKGRLFLDQVAGSSGVRPRMNGKPVEITFNGRRYSVRLVESTDFTTPYRPRKTEGIGLRTATRPKRYYIFKPL